MSFRFERDLLEVALTSPAIPLLLEMCEASQPSYVTEPKGLFGIPDMLCRAEVCSETREPLAMSYAFELKLCNWQRALVQAFRYRSFAEYSFVLLDHSCIGPSLGNLGRFRNANVGLLSMNERGDLYVHYWPDFSSPFSSDIACKLDSISWRPWDSLSECLDGGSPSVSWFPSRHLLSGRSLSESPAKTDIVSLKPQATEFNYQPTNCEESLCRT